jgi:hypothetical protein
VNGFGMNRTAMLLSGLASIKKRGKKQPMMPESSEAGAPQKIATDCKDVFRKLGIRPCKL